MRGMPRVLTIEARLLACLSDGFAAGADPDAAPWPAETLDRVRSLLSEPVTVGMTAMIQADDEALDCLETCFTVGAERDEDVSETDYAAVLEAIRQARR